MLTIFPQKVQKIICSDSPNEAPNFDTSYFKVDSHKRKELLYIFSGTSYQMLQDKVFLATPGTVFLINSWEKHAFEYGNKDNNLMHMWLHCDKDHMAGSAIRIISHGNYMLTPYKISYDIGTYDLLLRKWDEYKKHQAQNNADVNFYLKSILNILLEDFLIKNFIEEKQNSKSIIAKDDIPEIIRNYIKQTNGKNCTMKHLEKISGYNRYYLAHIFREKYNQTIGNLINMARVEYTRNALAHKIRQKEISAKLGFGSPVSFNAWWRKQQKQMNDKV